jgi:hypothetical protein
MASADIQTSQYLVEQIDAFPTTCPGFLRVWANVGIVWGLPKFLSEIQEITG